MEDGGIIPARAGFTLGLPPRRRGRRDHPRSHGVYQWDEFLLICSLGSSPLARGLHGRAHRRLRHPRIIPARAGFTCPASPAPRSSQDHPRSRGVYDPRPAGRVADLGSSPLARGLRRHPLLHRRLPGIIPARAGFTMASWRPACQRADHPRSRGVYGRQRRRANAARGSSPLARGLQIQLHLRRKQPGIIPARAGFTSGRPPITSLYWDHPRSRGVYGPTYSDPVMLSGSSPLARGLRLQRALGEDRGRIIPARAGFTSPRRSRSLPPRDHPRSRGVYTNTVPFTYRDGGSSPLARGLHAYDQVKEGDLGIIPARAGFTATM